MDNLQGGTAGGDKKNEAGPAGRAASPGSALLSRTVVYKRSNYQPTLTGSPKGLGVDCEPLIPEENQRVEYSLRRRQHIKVASRGFVLLPHVAMYEGSPWRPIPTSQVRVLGVDQESSTP